MRKWILVGLIVSLVFIFIFYNGNRIPIENNNIKNQTLNWGFNRTDNNLSQKKDEEKKYNPALEMLYKGYMDTVEFGIGTSGIEIIEQWGEPNQKDNFMGGLLLAYDDIYFFTDGLILKDSITYGDVMGIYYTGDETVYGIQIGMPLEQVKEILGSPDNTYSSHYSELYNDNNLIVNYKAGEYEVNFEIDDKNETVQSISVWKEEE